MKKLVVVLLLIGIALPVLANDALVLPQGIGRVYVVPVYGWGTGSFDGDGKFEEAEKDDGTLDTLFNLGVAGEYGVTDQISVGVQWAPGYNLRAELDTADDNATIRGSSPLTIGTEIGIMGSRGWVQSDTFRIQAAAGFEIPFQPDWKEQGKNAANDNTFTSPQSFIIGVAPHYAVGGGLSFDYVVMDGFYLNLFSEVRQHFGRTFDLTDYYEEVGTLPDGTALGGAGNVTLDKAEWDIAPFTELDLEFEPNYEIALSDGFDLGFGLPVTFAYTGERDLTVKTKGDSLGGPIKDETDVTVTDSYTVTLGPTVSAFITSLPLPMEFVGYWNWPVAGEDASRVNQLVLETRVYFSTGG